VDVMWLLRCMASHITSSHVNINNILKCSCKQSIFTCSSKASSHVLPPTFPELHNIIALDRQRYTIIAPSRITLECRRQPQQHHCMVLSLPPMHASCTCTALHGSAWVPCRAIHDGDCEVHCGCCARSVHRAHQSDECGGARKARRHPFPGEDKRRRRSFHMHKKAACFCSCMSRQILIASLAIYKICTIFQRRDAEKSPRRLACGGELTCRAWVHCALDDLCSVMSHTH
jgi:hypothetical protein